MTVRIVILGAGFGGLELTTLVADACGENVEIVLIDKSPGFVFGFSKLDVMFGRMTAKHAMHRYVDVVKPGVTFVAATITSIDPISKRVETEAGTYDAEILVVALGADLHPDATPGLLAGGHEFYTVPGSFALREVIDAFPGGKVIVGVTSSPFKCPPAPSEMALLMHDHLVSRGIRESSEISLVMPLGVPIPPSPAASAALLDAFRERGIGWHPERLVRGLDAERKVALLSDGEELPYDLFLGVPVHRVPDVVEQSGLTVDGWIQVNPLTLETDFAHVYAVGDVASVGTPKAGVFAEGQAAVVAARIIAMVGGQPASSEYDGHGMCYLEFGHKMVAKVDVTFQAGQRPKGDLEGPSALLAADKDDFGSSRIQRWFGREWSASN